MGSHQIILWTVFGLLIIGLLILDLGVFHKRVHIVKVKEALLWSCGWITLAAIFNLVVWYFLGSQKALEFLTGYLIEESLSVDNLFVFIMIFSYFAVLPIYHHRVLFWGIMGAVIMRAIFIASGTILLNAFHWIVYVFGFFLVITGIKMLLFKEKEIHPEKNFVVRLFKKFVPVCNVYEGQSFFVRKEGKLCATTLFIVLIVVETTDVIFATDSIPAIFAITRDPFIVYTSNIFAILGLRALYFLLAGIMDRFVYLKTGLSFVLSFVGIKMLIADFYKMPILIALGVVATILAGSIIASLLKRSPSQRTL
jgi:tellurite resistance protein TerC